jgi:hypothetical protein
VGGFSSLSAVRQWPRKKLLRFRDLRHFRRRRKAFHRRREDGVGVGGAGGRLIELGERKRRAQFEAARPLTLSDGDGGPQGFFGGRHARGIALEQHIAADAMQLCVECAMANAFGRHQRFVEDGEGAVDVAGLGFGFGKRNLDEPVVDQRVPT